jgi:hypothetical protein
MALQYFLLIYSRSHRMLETVQSFSDRDDAGRAYTAAERGARGNDDLEVVLIGSDSLDTIKKTHGQYFDAPADTSRFLQPTAGY